MGKITMQKDNLIWTGIKKIPKTFTEKDINVLFRQLYLSDDYWKDKSHADWVVFLKLRNICLVATIYILGLRPKEACGLKFDDFNFKTSYVKISGENNKTKKDRTLPVPKILINYLKPYLNLPKERFWKGSKYLFPSMENERISPERLKHIFREKVLKPCGLWNMPKKGKVPTTRLYTLRHTRATKLMKNQIDDTGNADIYAIANILGHSDLRSTMIYLHADEEYGEYLRCQLEKI